MQQERMCQEHNLPIIYDNITEQGSPMQCEKCLVVSNLTIQELTQTLNELRQNKIAGLTEQQNQSEKRLEQLKKTFLMVKEKFNQQIEAIIQIIENGRNEMISNINKDLEQLLKPIEQMTNNQVDQHIKELKKSPINNQIFLEQDQKIRIQSLEQYIQLVKLLNKQVQLGSVWNQLEKVEVHKTSIKIVQNNPISLGQYAQILRKNSIYCQYAMAMDKDEKILVNGQGSSLSVWIFKQDGSLTLKQKLSEQIGQIHCLCFSRISHWLICGSLNSTLSIWKEEQNGAWNEFQVLEGHEYLVNAVVLNSQEDQLISCSKDKTINVWMKKMESNKWECNQILTEHTGEVSFLSFNPDCNILASSGLDNLRIWEKGCDKLWKQKQVIDKPENDQYCRICFIDANELIATTKNQGILQRLMQNKQGKYNVKSNLFLNAMKEEDPFVFQRVYNKQLQMAICRHSDESTYILMKQANGDFAIHQVLQGNYKAGYLTINGQYLILGDYGNCRIGVWKLK